MDRLSNKTVLLRQLDLNLCYGRYLFTYIQVLSTVTASVIQQSPDTESTFSALREATFSEPMECLALAKPPSNPEWVYEIKLDGIGLSRQAQSLLEETKILQSSVSAHRRSAESPMGSPRQKTTAPKSTGKRV